MAMSVSLGPLEKFVQEMVKSGLYTSSSEVIRDALRLFVQKKQEEQNIFYLREAIQNGIDSGDSKPLDIDEIILEAKSRREKRK